MTVRQTLKLNLKVGRGDVGVGVHIGTSRFEVLLSLATNLPTHPTPRPAGMEFKSMIELHLPVPLAVIILTLRSSNLKAQKNARPRLTWMW